MNFIDNTCESCGTNCRKCNTKCVECNAGLAITTANECVTCTITHCVNCAKLIDNT